MLREKKNTHTNAHTELSKNVDEEQNEIAHEWSGKRKQKITAAAAAKAMV